MNVKTSLFINSGFLLLSGLVLMIQENVLLLLSGFFLLFAGISSLLCALGVFEKTPAPVAFKKWVLFRVVFLISMRICPLLGVKKADLAEYFIQVSNTINGKLQGNILLLLPRCLQNSTCKNDVCGDVENCQRCGRCQTDEIVGISPENVTVRMAGGGRQAMNIIEDLKPDGVIAVACEEELAEGINRVWHIPIHALRNLRPNGPCQDTCVDIYKLKDKLEEIAKG